MFHVRVAPHRELDGHDCNMATAVGVAVFHQPRKVCLLQRDRKGCSLVQTALKQRPDET